MSRNNNTSPIAQTRYTPYPYANVRLIRVLLEPHPWNVFQMFTPRAKVMGRFWILYGAN